MNKTIFRLLTLSAICLSAACSHPISQGARQAVDPSINLEIVRENPAAHVGKNLLLGGLIVGNKASAEGSELEIYSYRLALGGEPSAPRKSEGRFLARTAEFLDPVLFAQNRLVTLTGAIEGVITRTLAGSEYRYPLIRIGEIHLWPQERPRPPDYYYYPYPYRPWPYFSPFYPDWYYRDWYYRDFYRRRRY